jgi:hypothetical protein
MDERQSTDAVLLVRPAAFGFHAEAAMSNVFAHAAPDMDTQARALREFDRLAQRLEDAGVEVVILDDSADPQKPDAVFPNNWVSFHADGTMVLYPMATEARRLERDPHRLAALLEGRGLEVRRTVDLSRHERDGRFLEGTGSLVLDRPNRRAYASLGPRTHADVIADFDRQLGDETYVFGAHDPGGRPIYHTNVLLSLGTKFAALCLEAVAPENRSPLTERIEASDRRIIELSFAQLRRFGCNLIELRSRSGEPLIAMSSAARARLTPDQVRTLEGFGELVDVAIPTIEAVGGGSVRCMIAEIHLPRV